MYCTGTLSLSRNPKAPTYAQLYITGQQTGLTQKSPRTTQRPEYVYLGVYFGVELL
jgi:hypothetical protein